MKNFNSYKLINIYYIVVLSICSIVSMIAFIMLLNNFIGIIAPNWIDATNRFEYYNNKEYKEYQADKKSIDHIYTDANILENKKVEYDKHIKYENRFKASAISSIIWYLEILLIIAIFFFIHLFLYKKNATQSTTRE